MKKQLLEELNHKIADTENEIKKSNNNSQSTYMHQRWPHPVENARQQISNQ